ncbi:MAG: hypothetical protein KIT73_00970 [Burkholderiales bacterium]|nr:hypothetical protein [Burkholderiales bacterium]
MADLPRVVALALGGVYRSRRWVMPASGGGRRTSAVAGVLVGLMLAGSGASRADADAPLRLASVADRVPGVTTPVTTQPGGDRLALTSFADSTVITVDRVRGIGALEFSLPSSGPWTVLLRMRGFTVIESLTVESSRGTFECTLAAGSRGSSNPWGVCRLGDAEMPGLSRTPEGFEVRIPERIVRDTSDRIAVRWVDQWR